MPNSCPCVLCSSGRPAASTRIRPILAAAHNITKLNFWKKINIYRHFPSLIDEGQSFSTNTHPCREELEDQGHRSLIGASLLHGDFIQHMHFTGGYTHVPITDSNNWVVWAKKTGDVRISYRGICYIWRWVIKNILSTFTIDCLLWLVESDQRWT